MAKEKIVAKDAVNVFKKVSENLKNGIETDVEIDEEVMKKAQENIEKENTTKPWFVFSVLACLIVPLIVFIGALFGSGYDIYNTIMTDAPNYIIVSKFIHIIYADSYVWFLGFVLSTIAILVICLISGLTHGIKKIINFKRAMRMAKEIAEKAAKDAENQKKEEMPTDK